MSVGLYIAEADGGVTLDVKVVPGASRDQIVGPLGAALKVKVSAPPEAGKANAAVCALLAQALGVSKRDVRVVTGHGRPSKTIRIVGISAVTARNALSAT